MASSHLVVKQQQVDRIIAMIRSKDDKIVCPYKFGEQTGVLMFFNLVTQRNRFLQQITTDLAQETLDQIEAVLTKNQSTRINSPKP